MRKYFKCAICLCVAAITAAGFSSCGNGSSYHDKPFVYLPALGTVSGKPPQLVNFTFSSSGALTDRMEEASEISVITKSYTDTRKLEKDGHTEISVSETKFVLYEDYILESKTYVDNECTATYTYYIEQVSDSEAVLITKSAYDNLEYETSKTIYEPPERYYRALLKESRLRFLSGSNSFSFTIYKKNNVYSWYSLESSTKFSHFTDVDNDDITLNCKQECLIQLQVDDGIDRFERKILHEKAYTEYDYYGKNIDSSLVSETITEITPHIRCTNRIYKII